MKIVFAKWILAITLMLSFASIQLLNANIALTDCNSDAYPDHIIEYKLPALPAPNEFTEEDYDTRIDVDVGDIFTFTNVARIDGREVNASIEILEIDSTASEDEDAYLLWKSETNELILGVQEGTYGSEDNNIKVKISFMYADDGSDVNESFMFTASDIDGGSDSVRYEYIHFFHDEYAAIRLSEDTALEETDTDDYVEYEGQEKDAGDRITVSAFYNQRSSLTLTVVDKEIALERLVLFLTLSVAYLLVMHMIMAML